MTAPATPPTSPTWRRVAFLTALAVLALVACHWQPDTGFTALIRFGENYATTQLPEVRALPVALAPATGYDGQFYAQIAVAGDLERDALETAVPDLSYRARRILLPALAHGLGFGDPWTILQVYALLNIVAWLALAWIWARECRISTRDGFARWAVAMLSLGALDSVRMSLTDLPATLLIVLGTRALIAGRTRFAALWLACGGLIRETAILAALRHGPADSGENGTPRHAANRSTDERRAGSGTHGGIVGNETHAPTSSVIETKIRSREPGRRFILRWAWRAAVALPIVAWSILLRIQFPDAPSNIVGNFDWPGASFARHLLRCTSELAGSIFDSRHLFGLLGGLGLAGQSLYVLLRWRDPSPWLRTALPFAILFWFLGDYVWHGYWAAARVCLPLTFAFIRTAPLTPFFFLTNLSLLHAIYRLLP